MRLQPDVAGVLKSRRFPGLWLDAEQLVERGERVFGPDDYRTLDLRTALGAAHRGSGDLAAAVEQFRRANDGNVRGLGEAHDNPLNAGRHLARAHLELGDTAAAVALMTRLLASLKVGDQLPLVSAQLTRLLHGVALHRSGETTEGSA